MKKYNGTYIDFSEGWHHESEMVDIDGCKDELQKIYEAIFITGDVEAMVDAVEDLAGRMDFSPDLSRMVNTEFKITRSEPLLAVVNG